MIVAIAQSGAWKYQGVVAMASLNLPKAVQKKLGLNQASEG